MAEDKGTIEAELQEGNRLLGRKGKRNMKNKVVQGMTAVVGGRKRETADTFQCLRRNAKILRKQIVGYKNGHIPK